MDLNGKGAADYVQVGASGGSRATLRPRARSWLAGGNRPTLRVQVIVPALSTMPNGIAWHQGSLYIASLAPYESCKVTELSLTPYLAGQQAGRQA